MIQPIDTAPKTRAIMLIEKGGRHVEARWQSYSEKGETLWEGWCYEDAILADVAPEGPDEPTHWYDKPSIDQPARTGLPRYRASYEEWCAWISRNVVLARADYLHFPGTPVQAVTIARVTKSDDRFCITDVQQHYVAELPSPVLTPTDPQVADIPVSSGAYWCPVIRDRSTGAQFLIDPLGGVHSAR